MAAIGRQSPARVIERLHTEPQKFDFFAAVACIERRKMAQDSGRPVDWNVPPHQQPVRFTTHQSLSFPNSDISAVSRDSDEGSGEQIEMAVSFMGLTGPHGVLPKFYTQLVLDELRDARRRGAASERGRSPLQDFLDLFNHRQIVLFYRASHKYRPHTRPLPPAATLADEAPIAGVLFSLVGLGIAEPGARLRPPAQRGRLRLPDEVLLYFSGLFSHWPRSAVALEQAAAKLFGVPLQIEQFRQQWLQLRPQDQSQLPRRGETPGCVALGQNVVVGSRVPSHDTRFRVQLGPLSWRDFCRFTPDGDSLTALAQFVRQYVGPELDFDIQPVLKAAEIPATRLGAAAETPSRLGWNSWIWSRQPQHDAEDAVFVVSGNPN
jgi:type VI secretion system protein ImpH